MDENIKTKKLPVLVLRGKVMFPNISTSIGVGRPRSLYAVEKAVTENGEIFLVAQKNSLEDNPQIKDIYRVGVVCRVKKIVNVSKSNIRLQIEGLYRAKAVEMQDVGEYYTASVFEEPDEVLLPFEQNAYFSVAREKLKDYVAVNKNFSKDLADSLFGVDDATEFVNILAYNLTISETKKQEILSITKTTERLELLSKELNVLIFNQDIEKQINERVRESVDKSQKEYYLREQLKAINKELGNDEDEVLELREKILAKGMPKEDEEKVLKELDRMSRMSSSSPDFTVIRNYIDWILDIPFNEFTADRSDFSKAIEILEEDHFGLEKVKDRIIEYLAVMKNTGKAGASIICLQGPPGVGKTSVATSIARALDRKFVRLSLGGLKDEAEIRGHRKTYIGAMPGRIIYALKDAKASNPVILLDEIDKLSSDLRGDPASALLEVLDPEQNKAFRDRYIEIPVDLSNVLFITTANSLDTIPAPLLDRMELIALDGYTQEEKLEIAKRYLIPKRMKMNGLQENKVEFSDEAIIDIIKGYTKEAGVRNLERQIDKIIRKIVKNYLILGKLRKQTITPKRLKDFLGSARFLDTKAVKKDEVGVANGLAWTAYGGTTLNVEVVCVDGGKGEILLTGKLGDVMKESARTALSFVRANAKKFGIKEEFFSSNDFHIHVPEGATPKDGPSAGITLATAMLSAFTGKKVRADISMTGEITLRGKVLAIGGLKEKALASFRAGITEIIIPKENLKDIEDIPSLVSEKLTFHAVENALDVFKIALRG